MITIPSAIKPLLGAIRAILSEHPTEAEAATKLRRLAMDHHVYRREVFQAYRLLVQQEELKP